MRKAITSLCIVGSGLLALAFIFNSGIAGAACSLTADPNFLASDPKDPATESLSWASVREGSVQRFGYKIKNDSTATWSSSAGTNVRKVTIFNYMKIRQAERIYDNETFSGSYSKPFGGFGMVPYGSSDVTSCDRAGGYDSKTAPNVAPGTFWDLLFKWETPTSSDMGYHSIWAVIATENTVPTTYEDSRNSNAGYNVKSYPSNTTQNWVMATTIVPYDGITEDQTSTLSALQAGRQKVVNRTDVHKMGWPYMPNGSWGLGNAQAERDIIGLKMPLLSLNYKDTSGDATIVDKADGYSATVTIPSGSQDVKAKVDNQSNQTTVRNYFRYCKVPASGSCSATDYKEDIYNRDDSGLDSHPMGNTKDEPASWGGISISPGDKVQFCGQSKGVAGDISKWACITVAFQAEPAPSGSVKPHSSADGTEGNINVAANKSVSFNQWITATNNDVSYSGDYVVTRLTDGSSETSKYSGTFTVNSSEVVSYSPSISAHNVTIPAGKQICERLYIKTSATGVTVTGTSGSNDYADYKYAQSCATGAAIPTTPKISPSVSSPSSVYIGQPITFTRSISTSNVTTAYSNGAYKAYLSIDGGSSYESADLSGSFSVASDGVVSTSSSALENRTYDTTEVTPGTKICDKLSLTTIPSGLTAENNPATSCTTVNVQPGVSPSSTSDSPKELGEKVTFFHKITPSYVSGSTTVTYNIQRKILPANTLDTDIPTTPDSSFDCVYGSSDPQPCINKTQSVSASTVTVSSNPANPTNLYHSSFYIPNTTAVGSRICEYLTLVNTTGGIAITGSPSRACVRVVARPYVKFFGGDVSFCNGATGNVYTSARLDGTNYVGSSVQYALFAKNVVSGPDSGKHGFFSRSPSATSAIGPKYLTFANTGLGPPADTFGGGFGADIPCIKYIDVEYGISGEKLPNPLPIDGSIEVITSDTILNSGNSRTIADSKHITTYVIGDATIPENITYQNTTWANRDEIPSYRLIVKGDIYIGKAVTQLDGFYYATGNIYTCDTQPTSANFYNDCKNKLVVNGALQADGSIKYWRTAGTLKDADAGENSDYATNDSAETFILSPEMYLSKWRISGANDPFKGQAQSIRSLPPVF